MNDDRKTPALIDRYGRAITYLRVSVTDRCNFRCVYCMPPQGVARQSHAEILRYEEIVRIVTLAAQHGVREVRLTGGEPLVRSGIVDLVRQVAAIPGVEDVSLTTNGYLLEELARPLREAGLTRINVSLDTLQPEKFARITRGASFERTWAGLEVARAVGLNPIKLNAVAMRGVNDDELLDLARLTLERDWQVRFIELMPVLNQASWGEGFPPPEEIYLPLQEIKQLLAPLDLEPVETGSQRGSGPARLYRARGGRGLVGFISPLGEHFCQTCNRLRLTADGNLRPCLLSDAEIPVRDALRAGEDVLPLLRQAVEWKPAGHELSRAHLPQGRCMQQIGG